jgi:uncharacterized RDD family membrane protein YckC
MRPLPVADAYPQATVPVQTIQTSAPAWQSSGSAAVLTATQFRTDAFGGFWRRLLAYLIDALLLISVFFVIGMVLAVIAPNTNAESAEFVFNVLGILSFWVYYANMESGRYQGTLGKRALGLRVCDENGQRITFGRASGRFFGRFISGLFLGIGFLMIAFTKKKQGLHDKMASTLVVRTGE